MGFLVVGECEIRVCDKLPEWIIIGCVVQPFLFQRLDLLLSFYLVGGEAKFLFVAPKNAGLMAGLFVGQHGVEVDDLNKSGVTW